MKLRSRWILRLVGLLGAWLIRWWMSTVRCRVFFLDGVSHVIGQRRDNCIYAFWHEAILYTIVSPSKRVTVLIGQHADGELVTQVCNFLGFTVVRGSSTRGGGSALLGLCRMSRTSNIAVTPDGPHGPRRQVQSGLIYLASVTGLPIVVLGIGFSKAWRARSWDRFAVPVPWTTATCVVPPPIHVPPRVRNDGLEHYRRLVEEKLLETTAVAERWAQGGPHPSTSRAWQQQASA